MGLEAEALEKETQKLATEEQIHAVSEATTRWRARSPSRPTRSRAPARQP
jgi:hypothetical protein